MYPSLPDLNFSPPVALFRMALLLVALFALAPGCEFPGMVRNRSATEMEILGQAERALDLMERGSIPEAREEINNLTDRFPGNKSARLVQTLLLHRISSGLPEPEKTLVQRNPPRALEEYAVALDLLEKKKYQKSCVEMEKAHRLDRANREIADKLVFLLKQLGLDHYSNGETEKALVCWTRILEIRPDDREAREFVQRGKKTTNIP